MRRLSSARERKSVSRLVPLGSITHLDDEQRVGGSAAARLLPAADNSEREISLEPHSNARVELSGQKVEYAKLKKGDVVTFRAPEGSLGVDSDPDPTAAVTIIRT